MISHAIKHRLFQRLFVVLVFTTFFAARMAPSEIDDQLLEATRKGDLAAVKSLLAKGANVDAPYRYGETALFFAADRGHTEIVKVLLERGAKVNVKDTFYGMTPLNRAMDKKHDDIVKLLIEKGADPSGVLMSSVQKSDAAMVKLILAKGGLPPDTLSSAMSAAVRTKKTELVDLFEKAGVKPLMEIQVDPDVLRSYEGSYKDERGSELLFSVKDGKLTGGPAEQRLKLTGIGKDTFMPAQMEGLRIEFNREGNKVTGFALKQGSSVTIFKKVDGQ